jgi:hypothetical protein
MGCTFPSFSRADNVEWHLKVAEGCGIIQILGAASKFYFDEYLFRRRVIPHALYGRRIHAPLGRIAPRDREAASVV